MKIQDFPLTDSFIITVFDGTNKSHDYSLSRDGWVTYYNGTATESNFSNKKKCFKEHTIIKFIDEKSCAKILKTAEIKIDRAAYDYIVDYLISNGWDKPIEDTLIIIPKASKKLIGQKIILEFNLIAEDFKNDILQDLDVYMTPIIRTSKSLKFSAYVPKYIYDKCMTEPDVEKRPECNFIEADTIASLHSLMGEYSNQASNIAQAEKDAENSKKVICISFSSSETLTRDDYNHAYTGQLINTNFKFFIAYKINNPSFGQGRHFFTYKKYFSGVGSFDKGQKGIIDTGKVRNYLMNSPKLVIDWTQEREDYLYKLEDNFRKLSENLNTFLKDINEEKLELLMAQSNHLLSNVNDIKLLNL